jgi:hypothetical protein
MMRAGRPAAGPGLRGRGPRPDRRGARHLRQHHRQRHPGHGGGPASLRAPSALVLWTRHRRPPDLTPAIRSWFREAGFREEAFDVSHDGFMSVGAYRLTGEPAALMPGQRLFTFAART